MYFDRLNINNFDIFLQNSQNLFAFNLNYVIDETTVKH